MSKSKFVFLFLGLLFIFRTAYAADLFLAPESGDVYKGQQFDVTIRISAGAGEPLNAAQIKINFSKELLEVVSLSRVNSVFNTFLTDERSYSNTDGTIDLIGGIGGVGGAGISGAALEVIKITFKAKELGTATASIAKGDSSIAANDGRGTNILLNVRNGKYNIITAPPTQPGAPPAPPPPPAPVIPPPVQIVRPTVPAVELPRTPALAVVLYPDATIWYNRVAPFLAQWALPETVTAVGTALDRNPTTEPSKTEGLFENKIFPSLENGPNYLHVQFRNTKGKSPVAHYRLAIDTSPPLPLEISVKEGVSTDNPQPTLSYVTGDYISGIARYEIKLAGRDPIITQGNTYKLPLLAPGKQLVTIRAYDMAGNFAEGKIELDILPIVSPEITYIARDIFVGETSIPIKGTALANARVIIFIKKITGETIFTGFSETNNDGLWEAVLTAQLMKGEYYAEVRAQDSRGALSLPVQSQTLRVRERPAFIIGTFEVTQFWLFTGLILILLGSFSSGFVTFRLRETKHRRRINDKIIIAQRDIHGSFSTIKQSVEKFGEAVKDGKVDMKELTEMKFGIDKLQKNLEKMEEYIVEGIEEIKD